MLRHSITYDVTGHDLTDHDVTSVVSDQSSGEQFDLSSAEAAEKVRVAVVDDILAPNLPRCL